MSGFPGRKTPVLVDTNVIIASHRIGAWRALVGAYLVETVEDCATETQTGFQMRRSEQMIDASDLQASLAGVHVVGNRERAELAVRIEGIALDKGEEALWAHALGREGAWLLCGPDKASLRCGVRLGFRERIVSLETLLENAGYRPKIVLREPYTKKWLERTLIELVFDERSRRMQSGGVGP
ncbi:MAG: hypothetical protein F4X97_03125 [Boseongicola sp. SB0662_bin_57]|nr:hypothetical protein [Boseongicola sp. SB0662_bin_57]